MQCEFLHKKKEKLKSLVKHSFDFFPVNFLEML
jgi:hypothetical protein